MLSSPNRAFRAALPLALAAGLGWAPNASAQQAAPSPAPQAAENDYVIGPGDALTIFVWKEAELTREVNVRVDGKITVPLLGDVQAAGLTPAHLSQQLSTDFSRFLASPQVTVGVTQANSARFYVLGQVTKPGDFPLAGRMTVLQGLALAGGLKEFAKSSEILIVRYGKSGQGFIPVNYKKLESGQDPSQNVVLRPGDTILVP